MIVQWENEQIRWKIYDIIGKDEIIFFRKIEKKELTHGSHIYASGKIFWEII